MGIRAVISDIGGVLEHTSTTGWQARWETRLGLGPGGFGPEVSRLLRPGEVGGATYEELQARVAAALSLSASASEELWRDIWEEYLGSPNGELVTYLASLRPTYKVALLTNSFVGAREREEAAYGFSAVCDVVIYSHEEGLAKPDPAFYRLACERLAVTPEEVVFVDDREAAVAAAADLGMTAIRFSNNAETIPAIQECLSSA